MWTDGQTDMTKPSVAFNGFANGPKIILVKEVSHFYNRSTTHFYHLVNIELLYFLVTEINVCRSQ